MLIVSSKRLDSLFCLWSVVLRTTRNFKLIAVRVYGAGGEL